MPSQNKTSLGLNQWNGNEYPKRIDFNEDNKIIDYYLSSNKSDILTVKNELDKSDNTKYSTVNGTKEFDCKDGYIDNIHLEGETLVNRLSKLIIHDSQVWSEPITDLTTLSVGAKYTFVTTVDGKFALKDPFGTDIVFDYTHSTNGKIVFTVSDNYIGTNNLRLYSDDMEHSAFKSGSYMILEGDHTNKQIPYFEGLKSIGQGDKIEVLSYSESNIMKDVSIVRGKYLNTDGVTEVVDSSYGYTDYIPIENVCYFSNFIHGLSYYDSSKSFIKYTPMNYYIPLVNNAKFIRVNINLDKIGTYIITKGSIDKKQISTTSRSLLNGVKDALVKMGNSYYKLKKCEEVVLNGDNYGIILFNEQSSSNTLLFSIKEVNIRTYNNKAICDKFLLVDDAWYVSDVEGFSEGRSSDGTYSLNFRINKSKLSSQDVAGFKTWLKANPVTIVYELETPVLEEMPNFNPMTFGDKTTFLLNSGVVQGECSFEVTNSLGSEIDVLKNKVSDLDDYVVDEEVYYPTLLNGWVVTYPSSYGLSIKKIKNTVIVSGRISKGSYQSYTTLSILPLNLTPKKHFGFNCFNRIDGKPNGTVWFNCEKSIVELQDLTNNSDVVFNGVYILD